MTIMKNTPALPPLFSNEPFLKALALDEQLPLSSFRQSIRMQFLTKGKLSEKQVACFINAVNKDAAFEAKKAAWKAEQTAKTNALLDAGVKAPEGRVPFTGVVRKVKTVVNNFGGTTKLLIESEAGAKVWVSMPSVVKGVTIENFSDASLNDVLVGKTVNITATFKVSETDGTFAFGSRPNPMTVL
jgi:hypothetical protein